MHELAEAIMDTLANLWVQMNFVDPESGRAYNEGAFELCDWCQNSAFTLKAADGTVVDCSDFCLPTFFNPDASGEKLTYMGTIDTPGMVAPGGYGIVRCAASESEIFGRLRRRVSKRIFHGEKPPEWREKMFHVKKHSRTKRRLGT
jgi:hypothetical protein